ncbi:MAG: asparagine--tRNA ligase [Candidatus Cloacimonetes bacterium]|nr:asparagine--tRNA ligase [Candidatus Cloacimonadota bacterium]MBS3767071.1 asparagine--tRNA ligase [Candidatus Cloacimonadota bacterium]
MAEHVLIKDVGKHVDEEVILSGWVRNKRSSGKIQFIILRDGTAEIQAVAFHPNLTDSQFEKCENLTMESSVKIWGKVKKDERSPTGYELDLTNIEIIQIAAEYPIQKKSHGVNFLLDNRHLWVRSRKQHALLKIRHTVYYAITTYLNENGFYRYDSPILTPNACEGTTTLFKVPYFDIGKAYLSQSGQLYAETGIMSLGRVYDFGPTFRAEKSKTRKHLTEFWMMDAEAAFVKHKENMKIQEELIRFVIRQVIKKNENELKTLKRDIETLRKADAPFKVITHKEAIDLLQTKGYDIGYDEDFGAEEEEAITEDAEIPVFVEKWPKHIKSFYMKIDPDDKDISLCDDLIAPEGFGEIIGGSEREDDYKILKKRMKEEELPMDEYQWYLDLRRYGTVPHSGFGVGLERLIGWMSGVRHIRQTIPFPRMINRVSP